MDQDPALAAVKTYRYLRLAMVAMVGLLAVAAVLEVLRTDPLCVQDSISAYYYTPVRGVFIGTLVTIGVCLVALKGNTDTEDVLLNLAGMLAPGVAFIPTRGEGPCPTMPLTPAEQELAIGNNMMALFVAGAIVAVVAVVLARRQSGGSPLARWDRIGIAGALAILVGGAGWYAVSRTSFVEWAHEVSAVPMFLLLIVVVWLNGRDAQQSVTLGTEKTSYVRTYRGIATAMLLALALTVAGRLLTSFTHVILGIEVILLILFAAFWVIQTKELWNKGLRT